MLRLEGDVDKQIEIKDSPNTKRWWDEGMWLKGVSAEDFCRRIDGVEVREALGNNFLGAEAWPLQGIDVGEVPLLPASITKELLESECPLHPRRSQRRRRSVASLKWKTEENRKPRRSQGLRRVVARFR